MGKEKAVHRSDSDYAVYRYEDEDTFTFKDKRTGHIYRFNDCIDNGFGGNVFLYHYPMTEDDPSRTGQYKCGYLNKDSLPQWLIDEFAHIKHNGCVTPATDPRGE